MHCNRSFQSHRGAKHRYLIFMYLTCFILSLIPTISAPPERGFNKGQPEMHQAMDNMVAHGVLMKKTGMAFPATDGTGYPALLTSKTSNLLDEAEHVLSTLKDSKEKQWVAAFVQRMRAIAEMLEKTADRSILHLSEDHNSMSGTPVPEGLPSQSPWTAATAVPGSNPFQKSSKMVSKFPVTSPELSQVLPANENPSESLVVTKPATLPNKQESVEEDELVRELQNLHKEVAFEVPIQNSKISDMTPTFTTLSTPETTEKIDGKANNVAKERDELRMKLRDEIAQFRRLGGIPNDIVNSLKKEKPITTDSSTVIQTEGTSKSEATPIGTAEKTETKRIELDDAKNGGKEISKANPESLELQHSSNQEAKQFQQMRVNYPYMSPFPRFGNHFQYMPSQSIGQPYQRGLGYGAGNLYKPNPFNFHGNYQAIGYTNQQLAHIPDALRQRMPWPQGMVYNGHLRNSDYNEYLAKTRYGQYPPMQQWQNKNSTLTLPPGASPYITRPLMNHQIDNQLSDEMKRQLRDGKIVVLSDSVVRTNFQADNVTEENNNKTKQPDIMVDKNGTQTTN